MDSRQVLALYSAAGATDGRAALVLQNRLAMLDRIRGQFDKAELLLLAALKVQTAQFGADDPDTLISRHNLAMVYQAQRKYDKAEPLSLAVVAGRTAKFGADHPETLVSKSNLAGLYRLQGKYGQAEPLLLAVLKAQTALLGAEHLETLSTTNNLALTYLLQGKYDPAEPLFAAAARGMRKKFGFANQRTQQCVYGLIDCYGHLGRPADAEPLCRELTDHWKRAAGAESPQYAAALATLGHNLLLQKKWPDAETTLRECLAVFEPNAPRHWQMSNAKSLLSGAFLGQMKYAEAEPLLRAGYEGLKQREAQIPPVSKARLPEAAARLAELCDATGRADEAAKWRAEQAKKPFAAPKP